METLGFIIVIVLGILGIWIMLKALNDAEDFDDRE